MSEKDVSNKSLNHEQGGTSWTFKNATSNYSRNGLSTKEVKQLETVILGDIQNATGNNHIVHDGIIIKKSGSWDVGVPDSLNFAVDATAFATEDLLSLYGWERFHQASLVLVTQRILVPTASASRPRFSKWHDHQHDGDFLELTYQFSTTLPTEIQAKDGSAICAHNNALIRMSVTEQHRSQTNQTQCDIPRTWGAILVYSAEHRGNRDTPFNPALHYKRVEDGFDDYDRERFQQNFKPCRPQNLLQPSV